jgi:hypothetical protein
MSMNGADNIDSLTKTLEFIIIPQIFELFPEKRQKVH